MGDLRVMYKIDGVQRYEKIDPKYVEYNNKNYIDEHGMLQNAELYAEGLREVGARDIVIEWDFKNEKQKSSGSNRQMFNS